MTEYHNHVLHAFKTIVKFAVERSSCLFTRRILRTVCLLLAMFILYYAYQVHDDRIMHIYIHDSYATPCELPELDPFDPEVMKFEWRLKPLQCYKNPTPIVFIDENNILQFNTTALAEQGETEASVHCDYYFIVRSNEEYKIDMKIEFSEPHPCNPPMNIPHDFFRVYCKGRKGQKLFDNTMTKIVKTKRELKPVDPDKDEYNIMLFGFDSVSRSSAIRQLPSTFRYLKENLKSIDFKGYTKVAGNTFPNVWPLLSGYHAYSGEFPDVDFGTEYLDGYPFIWKNYSAQGYVTMLAEDLPNLGMFNLRKIGFKKYPTDHYMRPYWLGNFKLLPMHNLVTHVQRHLQNFQLRIAPSAICNGNIPNHVTLMNYLRQFMLTYRKEKKFMFSFLSELGHEFQSFLNFGDNDTLDLLTWMKEKRFLEDTIVILFSDHGLNFGDNQHLFTARLENRLPWLSIVLPEKLTYKYPHLLKNIKINENRLSSTFDLHATLRDVLNSNFENPTRFYVNQQLRGISLFQELPKDRSCKDANIGESYCVCYKSEPVNVSDNNIVHKMALESVKHINKLLKESPQCAHLELNSTLSARKISQGLKHRGFYTKNNLWINKNVVKAEERDDTKYALVLTTTPGGAKFYATCSYNKVSETAIVLGNIDRINRYGNQSHCIDVVQLRPFCLCNDMVGKDKYRKR